MPEISNITPWQPGNIPTAIQSELNRRKENRSFNFVNSETGGWNDETGDWSKYKGPTTAWVRLCSNGVGREFDGEGKKVDDSKIKEGFVFFGGKNFYTGYGFGVVAPTVHENKTIGDNNESIIGYLPDGETTHIIDNNINRNSTIHVPAPEIEKISINIQKNLYRRISVEWVCFSKEQLEYMTPYFLVPGITCVIEWGSNHFNPKSLININDIKELKKLKNNPYRVYADNILTSNGNYDALIGIVTNFEWSVDGNKFKCKTEISSPDILYAGFALNANVVNRPEDDEGKENKIYPLNGIKEFFSNTLMEFRRLGTTHDPTSIPLLKNIVKYVQNTYKDDSNKDKWKEYIYGVYYGREEREKKTDREVFMQEIEELNRAQLLERDDFLGIKRRNNPFGNITKIKNPINDPFNNPFNEQFNNDLFSKPIPINLPEKIPVPFNDEGLEDPDRIEGDPPARNHKDDFDKPGSKTETWLNFGLIIEIINYHVKELKSSDHEIFRIDIDNVIINAHPNLISADGSILLIPNAKAPKYFSGEFGFNKIVDDDKDTNKYLEIRKQMIQKQIIEDSQPQPRESVISAAPVPVPFDVKDALKETILDAIFLFLYPPPQAASLAEALTRPKPSAELRAKLAEELTRTNSDFLFLYAPPQAESLAEELNRGKQSAELRAKLAEELHGAKLAEELHIAKLVEELEDKIARAIERERNSDFSALKFDYTQVMYNCTVTPPTPDISNRQKAKDKMPDYQLQKICDQKDGTLRDDLDDIINQVRYSSVADLTNKFEFPFNKFPKINGNLIQYPIGYCGYLKDLYVNIYYIKKLIDGGEIKTYIELIETILHKISSAAGGFWDFKITSGTGDGDQKKGKPASLKIIDNNFMSIQSQGHPYSFDYFDPNSLLLGYQFNPMMTNAQVIQIVYGQTNRRGTRHTLTNGTNELLDYKFRDRLFKDDVQKIEKSANVVDDSGFKSKMIQLQKMNEPSPGAYQVSTRVNGKIVIRRLAIPAGDDLLHLLLDDGDLENNPQYTGIMPGIQATFTIQGLGGLRTNMMFLVKNLPEPYSHKNIIFRIIDVQELIEAGKWTTTMVAGIIPLRNNIKRKLGIS